MFSIIVSTSDILYKNFEVKIILIKISSLRLLNLNSNLFIQILLDIKKSKALK